MTEDNHTDEAPIEDEPSPVELQPLQDVMAISQAEETYHAEMEKFQATQSEIIQSAEDTLPSPCPTCQTVVRADRDKLSLQQNAECFTCYTKTETHKTEVAKDTLLAEETSRIASLDLSDFEEWLFGDEMGQISLARLLTKVKREGYDFKPWQISIGASAWSLENYHNTGLVETRHIVERIPIKNLLDFLPQSTEDIVHVINSVKRAEESIAPNDIGRTGKIPIFILAGITGVAALIPLLLSRR